MAQMYYSTLQPLTVVNEKGELTYPFGPQRVDWTAPSTIPTEMIVHKDKIAWPAVVSHDQTWRRVSDGQLAAGLREEAIELASAALANLDGTAAAALAAHGVEVPLDPLTKLSNLQNAVDKAKQQQAQDSVELENKRKQAEIKAAEFARAQLKETAEKAPQRAAMPSQFRPGPKLAPVDHSYGTEEERVHAEASTEATADRLKDLSFDFNF